VVTCAGPNYGQTTNRQDAQLTKHACARVLSLGNRATVWRIYERKLRGEELLRKEEEDAIKAVKLGKRQVVPEIETYDQIVVRSHVVFTQAQDPMEHLNPNMPQKNQLQRCVWDNLFGSTLVCM
jgi:hypothetical protein